MRELADTSDWRHIREDVEVKICRGPDGEETFLLCRSASRVEKERAMHSRFAQRIEEGLESLGRRIAKAKHALDRGVLERQIGRLLGRNSRAAGRYAIAISEDEAAAAHVQLTWCARPEWDLLPGLCAMEDATAMAISRRPRRCPAHDSDRALAHSRRRHRAAAR